MSKITDMVRTAWTALEEKKAEDITVIEIAGLSVVADYFLIASAENTRQTEALCQNVEEKMAMSGFPCRQIEGRSGAAWILMDYNDVIVHIFDREMRSFYNLERIWRDAKVIAAKEELA